MDGRSRQLGLQSLQLVIEPRGALNLAAPAPLSLSSCIVMPFSHLLDTGSGTITRRGLAVSLIRPAKPLDSVFFPCHTCEPERLESRDHTASLQERERRSATEKTKKRAQGRVREAEMRREKACPKRSPTHYSECKAAEKSMLSIFHLLPDEIYLDSSSPAPSSAFRFAACLSSLRSRAALVRARLASISSLICLSRAFSALARWICNKPLAWYSSW
ncbi:hypothetical protein VTH06DRAFT_3066 [Thermothelomyces fergusii]